MIKRFTIGLIAALLIGGLAFSILTNDGPVATPTPFVERPLGAACTITLLSTVSTDTRTSGTSDTFAHTVDAGTDLLVVGVTDSHTSGGAGTPTGITFNGVALTKAVTQNGGTTTSVADIWYLASPTATSANVVITWGATGDARGTSVAYNLDGVDTADPTGNTNGASGQPVTSLSFTVDTTSASDWVVDALHMDSSSNDNLVPGADQVEIADLYDATNNKNGGYSYEIGNGTRTMSYSWATSDAADMAAVEINAASDCGGGGGGPANPAPIIVDED